LPIEGPVSSGFGPRTHPTGGEPSFHEGVDIAVPVGTPVPAIREATAVRSYTSTTAFGETIILRHGTDPTGNLRYTLYGHLSSRLVSQGDAVLQGQIIGLSGRGGTGPHLHYEVRVLPPGGPTPFERGFFDARYAVDPLSYG